MPSSDVRAPGDTALNKYSTSTGTTLGGTTYYGDYPSGSGGGTGTYGTPPSHHHAVPPQQQYGAFDSHMFSAAAQPQMHLGGFGTTTSSNRSTSIYGGGFTSSRSQERMSRSAFQQPSGAATSSTNTNTYTPSSYQVPFGSQSSSSKYAANRLSVNGVNDCDPVAAASVMTSGAGVTSTGSHHHHHHYAQPMHQLSQTRCVNHYLNDADKSEGKKTQWRVVEVTGTCS